MDERGVVRAAQLLAQQAEHARCEAPGLTQGEVEDEPQHQLDRRVRVPSLAAGRRPSRGLPRGQGILNTPECQVNAPVAAGLGGRPVLDAVPCLRNATAAGGEGHA